MGHKAQRRNKKNPDKATFWTLTISNEEYEKLKSDSKKKDRDSIRKLAVKRMLERIRKKTSSHDSEEREHQRQLEYMGLQAQYNKEQAKYCDKSII